MGMGRIQEGERLTSILPNLEPIDGAFAVRVRRFSVNKVSQVPIMRQDVKPIKVMNGVLLLVNLPHFSPVV